MTTPTSRKLEKKKNALIKWAKRAESFEILGRKHAISPYSDGKSQVFCRYNNVLCWRTDEIPM